MAEAVVLYGRRYVWRDERILRGALHLDRAPDDFQGTDRPVVPWTASPCDTWLAQQRAKLAQKEDRHG